MHLYLRIQGQIIATLLSQTFQNDSTIGNIFVSCNDSIELKVNYNLLNIKHAN